MKSSEARKAVDLTGYPDLVVIYLGMRVRTLKGVLTLIKLGPQIDKAGTERPVGLLQYENNIIFSFFPLHVGMRWYWKDFESMEGWARSNPHRVWWQKFLRDAGGTGIWHETYYMRGGMEAIYSHVGGPPVGFQAFAPSVDARGAMFSARSRLRVPGDTPPQPEGMTEQEIT